MPEIDGPTMAEHHDDYTGPDAEPRPWREVIDFRRLAFLVFVCVFSGVALNSNPDGIVATVWIWVMAILILAIMFLAALYFPVKWAIHFVLKRDL